MKLWNRFRNYLRSDRAGVFYAAVTAVALILSVGMLVVVAASPRVAAPEPQSAETNEMTAAALTGRQSHASGGSLTLTDAEASLLLAAALRTTMNIEEVAVSFHAPETMRVEALVPRESVVTLMAEGGIPLADKLALVLPPEIALEVDAAVSAADGELRVVPVAVSTGGVDLSGLLPDSVAATAAEALGGALGRYVVIEDVEVSDGSVVFTISA